MKYLRDLAFVFSIAARLCGLRRLLLTNLLGCFARVALLAAFVFVIKLTVALLSLERAGEVVVGAYSIQVDTLLWVNLALIPLTFFAAGSLAYAGQVANARFVLSFVDKMRAFGLEAYFESQMGTDKKSRHEFVRNYVNRIDPEIRRGSKNIMNGLFEMAQSSIVAGVVFLALAVQDPGTALVTATFLSVALPLYVRRHASIARSESERSETLRVNFQEQRSAAINSDLVAEGKAEAAKQEVRDVVFGPNNEEQLRIEHARSLSARRAMGPVYGLMGIILAYLLADIFLFGHGVTGAQLSRFAIIALMLRFLAGEVQSMLTAARTINQDRTVIRVWMRRVPDRIDLATV